MHDKCERTLTSPQSNKFIQSLWKVRVFKVYRSERYTVTKGRISLYTDRQKKILKKSYIIKKYYTTCTEVYTYNTGIFEFFISQKSLIWEDTS